MAVGYLGTHGFELREMDRTKRTNCLGNIIVFKFLSESLSLNDFC